MKTIWQYRGDPKQKPSSALVEAAEGSVLVAKLLMNRGMTTPEAIAEFLDLDSYAPVSGLELPDMEKALARIGLAIERKESILIYGDFDVDGITGTSILLETLKFLGANVSYYIPDRATEGHGLHTASCLRLVSSRQVKLVITTDTGITNFAEISLLNGLGVDTIVTDHHELPENLPPSLANINPKLLPDQTHPLSVLCGAGVAYKLCELLLDAAADSLQQRSSESTPVPDITQRLQEIESVKIRLLDLTAVGTVADLASLLKENRYLVYQGVKVLNTRQRLGIKAILEQAGTSLEANLTSETIGFTIGPRLNALGRLENANQAVELLTTTDPMQAERIAMFLEQLNRKRRELCDKIFMEADRHIHLQGGLDGRRVIVLASPDWHLGVIGIVASRLIEKYHVPVFMMVIDEEKGVARCSARSIPGFHLHDELMPLADMFTAFGGHAGAGGFTIPLPKLNVFKEKITALADAKITDEQMLPIVDVDDQLAWSQINPHLVTLLARVAPYGMDNPAPKFVLENAMLSAQRAIGEGERHLKLILTDAQNTNTQNKLTPLEALCWNYTGKAQLTTQAVYRFVVSPELNTFNNNTKVQLIVDDIKPMGCDGLDITEAVAPPKTTGVDVGKPAIQSSAESSETRLSAQATSQLTKLQPKISQAIALESVKTPTSLEADSPPLLPKNPTASSALASLASSRSAEPIGHSISWIDHRGRESLDSFIGQLVLPLQDRSVLIYHEGRKPDIPFLQDHVLATRLTVTTAEELIFWDMPPSPEIFRHVLAIVQPKRVHCVGGKYQSVPVFQPEKNYINLLLQALKRELANQNTLRITISAFSSRLAITPDVVYTGLILLEKLGFIKNTVLEDDAPAVVGQGLTGIISAITEKAVEIALLSQTSPGGAVTDHLEFYAFREAIRAMAVFRNWLLSDSLDTIKAHFSQADLSVNPAGNADQIAFSVSSYSYK